MALSGNLSDFTLPDIFRLVSLSGKTGVLHLASGGSEGGVWFRDGQVFFAQSDRRKPLLGERLVTSGRISPDALAHAIDLRGREPEGGRRIGEILLDEGAITYPVLEAFVQEQIQDTVFDLFLWDDGFFEFEMLDAVPEGQDIGLAVSIENIVMEGARRLAEWTELRTSASSGSVVFRVGSPSSSGEETVDITLRPSEWRIVTLTDGTRTVAEVAEAAGVSEFDASRTLYGLFGAGLLQMVEHSEHDAAPEPPAFEDKEPDSASLLFLESEPVLAAEPEIAREIEEECAEEPEPEPEPEPESGSEPAPEPGLHFTSGPALDEFEQSVPPVQQVAWAGIGNEVAALTGATTRRARYAPPSAAEPVVDGSPQFIRRDVSLSREELQRIRVKIEEL